MIKLNINTPIKDINGNEVFDEFPEKDKDGNQIFDLLAVVDQNNQPIFDETIQEENGQRKIIKKEQRLQRVTRIKKIKRGLKETLLRALAQQYDRSVVKEPREFTWIFAISELLNNAKEDIVEIEEDRYEFLKKIVGNNKYLYFENTPQGIQYREGFLYTPFEAGQILTLLK